MGNQNNQNNQNNIASSSQVNVSINPITGRRQQMSGPSSVNSPYLVRPDPPMINGKKITVPKIYMCKRDEIHQQHEERHVNHNFVQNSTGSAGTNSLNGNVVVPVAAKRSSIANRENNSSNNNNSNNPINHSRFKSSSSEQPISDYSDMIQQAQQNNNSNNQNNNNRQNYGNQNYGNRNSNYPAHNLNFNPNQNSNNNVPNMNISNNNLNHSFNRQAQVSGSVVSERSNAQNVGKPAKYGSDGLPTYQDIMNS